MKNLILSFIILPLFMSAQEQGDRPNILLLVGDDMSFADISPLGSEVDTPNLMHLANDGIKFSNFHATPVCSVTRSELLTGNNNIEVGLGAFDYAVYPPAAGKPGYQGYLTRTTVTIAELLRDAGYHTYTAGKWMLYDILEDPGETNPLNEQNPKELKKLVKYYNNYAKERNIQPVAEDRNPWSAGSLP